MFPLGHEVCSKRKSKISVIKFSLQGTKGTKKIPDFKKSSNKKKRVRQPQMSPQEKCNAWCMYTLCALWIELFQPGIQITFSVLVESDCWHLAAESVYMPWRDQVVTCYLCLSFAPKLTALWIFFITFLPAPLVGQCFPNYYSTPLYYQRLYQHILAPRPWSYFRDTLVALVMARCPFMKPSCGLDAWTHSFL